jgi:thiol-disulfide isomerase/thioredoxin
MRLPFTTKTFIVATTATVAIGAAAWLTAIRTRAHEATSVACATGSACESHARAGVTGAAAKVTGQPRLLAFSSTTCVACKRMAPVIAEAERACAARDAVVHVNVDGDDGAALATTYDVTNIPAWVSIDADGEEVSRLIGVQPAEALARSIEELQGRRCEALGNVDSLPM